jgi:hypothetical protein
MELANRDIFKRGLLMNAPQFLVSPMRTGFDGRANQFKPSLGVLAQCNVRLNGSLAPLPTFRYPLGQVVFGGSLGVEAFPMAMATPIAIVNDPFPSSFAYTCHNYRPSPIRLYSTSPITFPSREGPSLFSAWSPAFVLGQSLRTHANVPSDSDNLQFPLSRQFVRSALRDIEFLGHLFHLQEVTVPS